MRITFFGAAQNVTGSKHLIQTNGTSVLFDCGLHQGRRHESYELNRALPFDAKSIDFTILSHAHADHCGMLPLLVHGGYQGTIFTTPASADIARLIMLDSAKLQEHDFQRMKELMASTGEQPLQPLYTVDDVEKTCVQFEPVVYDRVSHQWRSLQQALRLKLYDAGHILGSAVSVLQADENDGTKTIAFTGDLGNTHVPLLYEPEVPAENVGTLIMECTYGDRNHRPVSEVASHLAEIIDDAVRHKKKIIVPAFALGRIQELIYVLHELHDAGKIPAIPIYVDSPLGVEITEVFSKYVNDFDAETWAAFGAKKESPFSFQNLNYIRSIDESKALNTTPGPYMVIASSGMAEGGRVVYHLEHTLSDPNAVILLTGYQAEQTLGRKLQEGMTPVRMLERMFDVRATIITVDEFSAHADQQGLLEYVSKLKGLKTVFLVHTELPQATVFAELLHEKLPLLKVVIPKPGDSFEV